MVPMSKVKDSLDEFSNNWERFSYVGDDGLCLNLVQMIDVGGFRD